jgi:mannose-6-phosphate isomerase-like protein (cupin superfamily)
VLINGTLYYLYSGTLILIPKGVRRSTRAISANLAYLTVHQQRGPLKIRVPRRDQG